MAQDRASLKVEGLEEINQILNGISNSISKEALDGALSGAELIQGEARKLIAKESKGEKGWSYREGGNKVPHTTSIPGDAPNTDTGTLKKSVMVEPVPGKGAKVGSSLKYARALEFGYAPNNLEARPFLIPAFESQKKDVMKLIKQAVTGTLVKYDRK